MAKTASLTLLSAMFACAFAAHAYAADESLWKKDPKDWNVEIYPVYAWAPFMGATATLPSFPNLPTLPDLPNGDGSRPSGSANTGLSGAAFAGFRVEKSKWLVESSVLWAGLHANKDTPKVNIGLNVVFGQAMGGREVAPGLTVEGGFRRLALNMSAQLGNFPEISGKPGVWDPLVGVTYRRPLSRKWQVDLHGDGGGFGVGSDVTYAFTGRMDYRFSKHFGLALGYGLLHFKISNTVLNRSLTIDQTMHGPIFGFGIFF